MTRTPNLNLSLGAVLAAVKRIDELRANLARMNEEQWWAFLNGQLVLVVIDRPGGHKSWDLIPANFPWQGTLTLMEIQ